MRIHYNKCPVCGSNDIALYTDCKDFQVSGEVFSIFRCSVCLTEFTQDAPDENEVAKYYVSETYLPHSDKAKNFIARVYYAVRQLMLRRKHRLVKRITGKRRGRILDYGCGMGHFASVMKKKGWEIAGIEINEEARNYAAKYSGIEVFTPESAGLFTKGSFDCITFWHVLEHIYRLRETLVKIKKLLSPDGIAIIALPNNMSFDSLNYRNYWAAYDVPRHLWHFNPVSFSYIAALTGFEIKGIKRLPFDVFYISVLSEKNKGSVLGFLRGMFKGTIFYLLSLFDLTRSSSLIYILKPLH